MRVALPADSQGLLTPLPADVVARWYDDLASSREAVRDADAIWLGNLKRDQIPAMLDAGPGLRWLHTSGAGTDRHPLALYRARGLTFTNGSGIGATPISEYVVMMMLAAVKRLPDLVRAQDRAEWLRPGPGNGELFGSSALIVGYGAIGSAIGHRLRAFGVSVIGVRRRPNGEPGILGADEWRAQLPDVDWVILATMLTAQTRRLIGRDELAAMRPSAWLVNVGRGELVDQAALVDALRDGCIGGAYLDVMSPEPLPADAELWRLPNVIISPHSSWTSRRFQQRGAELFLDNLERFRTGQVLRNVVDLDAGHRVS